MISSFRQCSPQTGFAGQADTFAMPECRDEINPFLASIGTIRAGEQFVYPWKGLVSKRNEIVLQRHHILHVEIVLARAELQLFSNRFHRGIFPQIYPVVKSVLGDFHSVCFVSLDLADGTSAALLDEQWIYHGHSDTILVQGRHHAFSFRYVNSYCVHDLLLCG